MFVLFFPLMAFFMAVSNPDRALAEYRVFVLKIENSKTNSSRQFQSTLDPEQYATQFPLNKEEKISYVDTWRCWGRTDFFAAHCDRPDSSKKTNESPETNDLSPSIRSPANSNN